MMESRANGGNPGGASDIIVIIIAAAVVRFAAVSIYDRDA
jgi:hypothetical protein